MNMGKQNVGMQYNYDKTYEILTVAKHTTHVILSFYFLRTQIIYNVCVFTQRSGKIMIKF